MIKKTIVYIIALFGGLALFTGCGGSAPAPFRQVSSIDLDHGIFNYATIKEGADAHSGAKFARADSVYNYGLGYSYLLPDSMKGKTIAVTVNAWVRTGDMTNNFDIIVSCTSNDSILLWTGCGAKEFVRNPNEWVEISRTITLTPGYTSKNKPCINVMMHNMGARSYFDMDDLKIEYLEVKP